MAKKRDAFEILDPRNAQLFLKSFDIPTRQKGEKLYAAGRVEDLEAEEPGLRYAATVMDKEPLQVVLIYDSVAGWTGGCSCDLVDGCPHIYATLRSLLVEHNSALVRNLSAGFPGSSRRGQEQEPEESESGLARKLLATVGRPLEPAEKAFIRKVQATYARCRQTGHITRWDFNEMGLRMQGYGWEALQIWPSLPANESEFWLYIANAARENDLEIPAFMRPISNTASIQKKLAAWKRAREIERWTQHLGDLHIRPDIVPATGRNETDLRLMFEEKEASLQWLRPGRDTFESIKATQLNRLSDEEAQGHILFATEAALLWQLVAQRFFYGTSSRLRFQDPDVRGVLGRVLRAPLLESRTVNSLGQPLARIEEPLRWHVAEAENDDDDYRLRLIQNNGDPVPPVNCVIPGNPALYLCANALFRGPQPHDHVLEPGKETRIPAPALEQPSGVAFLQNLKLELPSRIRQRIQSLPLEVTIQCRLRPIYPGSSTEACVFKIVAQASDGHAESWSSSGWLTTSQSPARKRKRADPITVYDRTTLEPLPALLLPLTLKNSMMGELEMRVTKKFPEIFSEWLQSLPPAIKVNLEGELASFASGAISGKVKLDVQESAIDWFDLRVVLDVSDATLSPEEIKLLLNARGRYVRLGKKGWRRLQYDLSDDENDRLARLGLNPHELTAEPQRLHALQLADDAAKKFLPEAQVQQIQRRAGEIKARVSPPLPAGISAQLRPYQLEGFHFLAYLSANRFGGILADDMGLGKTVQTLSWLLWLREQPAAPALAKSSPPEPTAASSLPSLVVCPKSVMDNWKAEATRFAAGLRVKIWAANELSAFRGRLAEADLHVLNYSQLRLLGESLTPVQWLALILDEGQYVKNPNSQTAQIARALRAEHRLILSGTPIENRLLDLWSLMAFAMPGVLGSRAQFARSYDSKTDPLARRRLSSRVRPFLLRRTKTQVARDLPDRVEEDILCELEGEQKMLYRAELKHAQQMLLRVQTQKEFAEERFHFLTSLLRLRQICCHPRLVKGDSIAPSAKVEALMEQLEPIMEEGYKVLVFSQFVEMLQILKGPVTERGWPQFYLAGDTENRGELVQKFQATEGPAVFLISLEAGGFGLNLTAASYVVLFDPWWNPAVENQAIDRTHRIGQVNKVMAYRLLIKGSIEEKIRELQKQKKSLAEDVLGEERFAQSLTLQDLQFLFAD